LYLTHSATYCQTTANTYQERRCLEAAEKPLLIYLLSLFISM